MALALFLKIPTFLTKDSGVYLLVAKEESTDDNVATSMVKGGSEEASIEDRARHVAEMLCSNK